MSTKLFRNNISLFRTDQVAMLSKNLCAICTKVSDSQNFGKNECQLHENIHSVIHYVLGLIFFF